jgi:hypothetical protein
MFAALKWASDSVEWAAESLDYYWGQPIFTSLEAVEVPEATVEVPQVVVEDKENTSKASNLKRLTFFTPRTQVKSTTLVIFHRI